jgi:hypothetical protein
MYKTLEGEVYFNKSITLHGIKREIEEAPLGAWVFMHARKASAGMAGTTMAEKLERAHPVESDDKSILVLHNGTKSSLFATVVDSVSDSQALATLLSIAWEGRKTYLGNVGVVLYERKGEIYLYKDGLRPLVMSEDGTIFASEPTTDKVKWRNIKDTYPVGIDVKLLTTEGDLGLDLGPAVEVKFDIAANTIPNFSVRGYPRYGYCSTCKKSHLRNDKTDRCCVCSIADNIETKPKAIPATSSTPQKIPGIVHMSSDMRPESYQTELFVCDSVLLRRLGYTQGKYQGTAIIRTDVLYRADNGLLFVKPNAQGKYFVKVDRVFMPNAVKDVYNTWRAATKGAIGTIGANIVPVPLTVHTDLSRHVASKVGGFAMLTRLVRTDAETVHKAIADTVYFNELKIAKK